MILTLSSESCHALCMATLQAEQTFTETPWAWWKRLSIVRRTVCTYKTDCVRSRTWCAHVALHHKHQEPALKYAARDSGKYSFLVETALLPLCWWLVMDSH